MDKHKMNKRIRELMLDADYAAPELAGRAQHLVELVIRECLSMAQSHPSQNCDYAAGIDSVKENIKEHFGIEE